MLLLTRIAYRLGACCTFVLLMLIITPTSQAQLTCCASNSSKVTVNCSSPGCSGQVTIQNCNTQICEGFYYYGHSIGCCNRNYTTYITSDNYCLNPNCAAPIQVRKSPPENAPLIYVKDCAGRYVVASPSQEGT